MLLLCSFFRLRELFQVKNGSTTSLHFFLKKAKNLGRSDDAKWRKNRGWPNIYIFFQIDRLEPFFTDSVFRFRLRCFRFRIPDSGFHVLVLPMKYSVNLALDVQR